DPRNAAVLYVGTERTAYVSINKGDSWINLSGESLPTIGVDDLKIQSRTHDLVAGTHGRSVWILDDASPLSQLSQDIVESEFHVFDPRPAQPRFYFQYGDLWSDKMFIAQNPTMGAYLHYWIRDYEDESVSISIADQNGHVVNTLSGTNRPGFNRVVWNLQADSAQQLGDPHNRTEFVAPGEYTVTIKHGEHDGKTSVQVLPTPGNAEKE
ncbi:MAG: hypothetical protein O7G85_16085, partial [Planctomycetota bacterium]|nr:hypothetical protein [Planctomycetota bacterium]